MKGNLQDLLKIIDDKSSIVDIVSDYISLEKKGTNYIGLCPFHNDSKPSLVVSDNKNIYKCFSCGASGRSINFMQNYENISFIDAIKKISDKYKIDWSNYLNNRESRTGPIETRGWDINNEASNFFNYNLESIEDKIVFDYIKKRDLNKDIINKFKIGYISMQSSLSKFLLKKDFSKEEIINYGLGRESKNSDLHDYFINRLMFPIMDIKGNIIGFSGRVLENNNKYAKYLNSPETPIFKKNLVLYNLNNAKISAGLKKELIIVEGFMDVIALSKLGIHNVVATMGTSLSNNHIKILKPISTNILLALDSDVAGINATISIAKKLINNKFNVEVAQIPLNTDFDEMYLKNKSKIEIILKNKVDFLNFYKNMIYKAMDSKNDVSLKLIRDLLKMTNLYNDNLLSDKIINEISKKYDFSKDILHNELKSLNEINYNNNSQQNFSQIKKNYSENKENFNELNIFLFALKSKDNKIFQFFKENPIHWSTKFIDDVYNKFVQNGYNLENYDELIINLQNKINSFGYDDVEINMINNIEDFKQSYQNAIDLFNKKIHKLKAKEFKENINKKWKDKK